MPPTLFHPLFRPPGALLELLYPFVLRPALLLGTRLRGLAPSGPLILVCPPVTPLLATDPAALSSGSAVALAMRSSSGSASLLLVAPVLAVPAIVLTPLILATAVLTALIVMTSLLWVAPLLMLTAPLVAASLILVTAPVLVTALFVASTLILLTTSIALHPGHGVLDPVRDPALFPSPSTAAALPLPSALPLALFSPVVLFSPAHTGAASPAADLLSVELVLGTALIPATLPVGPGLLPAELPFSLAAPTTAELFVVLLASLSVVVASIVLIHWLPQNGTSAAFDVPVPLPSASH